MGLCRSSHDFQLATWQTGRSAGRAGTFIVGYREADGHCFELGRQREKEMGVGKSPPIDGTSPCAREHHDMRDKSEHDDM